MKITKSHLKQIIKEELEVVTEATQLAEFEGGPEVDIQDAIEMLQAEQPKSKAVAAATQMLEQPVTQAVERAIQMLEAEEDPIGTLFHVINRLYEALNKLGGESGLKYVGESHRREC